MDTLANQVTTIRQTLAWMDLVMANMDESVFVVNEKWETTFLNDSLVDLLGGMKVLLLGKPVGEVLPITHEGETLYQKIHTSNLSIENISELNGIYHLDKFQTSRIMDLRCTYIAKIRQAACVLTDITLETRATEKLNKLVSDQKS